MNEHYEIDYQDSKSLWDFSLKTCELADDYMVSRRKYGSALKFMKRRLAEAYRDDLIDTRISEEKAFLALSKGDERCQAAIDAMTEEEQVFKGLEKVIDARQAVLSFNQSLIKLIPR